MEEFWLGNSFLDSCLECGSSQFSFCNGAEYKEAYFKFKRIIENNKMLWVFFYYYLTTVGGIICLELCPTVESFITTN